VKVTTWIDVSREVEVNIGADDIRRALTEAFAATNQNDEEAVNVHDIMRAFSCIASFLRAFTDEQVALLNESQRRVIGGFLEAQSRRFMPTSAPLKLNKAELYAGGNEEVPDAQPAGRVANATVEATQLSKAVDIMEALKASLAVARPIRAPRKANADPCVVKEHCK
jgi:hypothetical protein